MINYSEVTNSRVQSVPVTKRWTVKTKLLHFAIITYAVPVERLRNLISNDFDIFTINQNGLQYGLISAVSFVDQDFHFPKLLPFLKFRFPQTNYRAYVINRKTGEHCAWFFGTSLGSRKVWIPKVLWRMPWFFARYKTNFAFKNGYQKYAMEITSAGANGVIDVSENSDLTFNYSGFESLNQAKFILTHPCTGYYFKPNKKLGQYKIWHPEMNIRLGVCNHAYFQKFAQLGLLNKEEMKLPYSVLLTDSIDFIIELPPRNY